MGLYGADRRPLPSPGEGFKRSEAAHYATVRHPANKRARLVRSLRPLQQIYGWGRLTDCVVPGTDVSEPFLVSNGGTFFSGDLSSFIDRHMYLFGGYEGTLIDLFLAKIPQIRRRVVFDIGANVGTHSLAFARAFDCVHAFEPNPSLWECFERNIKLNGFNDVTLHRVALGDVNGRVPFYVTDTTNFGLGTLSSFPQYDVALVKAPSVDLVTGDAVVTSEKIEVVDAVKIDVQGFECQVLKGMQETLRRSSPIVWVEVGPESISTYRTPVEFLGLFPFRARMYRFTRCFRGIHWGFRLIPADNRELVPGDYVVAPLDQIP
jgi:FkbM family methyltransferase